MSQRRDGGTRGTCVAANVVGGEAEAGEQEAGAFGVEGSVGEGVYDRDGDLLDGGGAVQNWEIQG